MKGLAMLLLFFALFSCQRGNEDVERAEIQIRKLSPFETVLQSFSHVAK